MQTKLQERIRKVAKSAVRRTLGPFGLELVRPTKLLESNFAAFANLGLIKVSVIFDVGANKGQSYRMFRSIFPQSTIYSFEPVSTIYDVMKAAGGGDPQFVPIQAGVGKVSETREIHLSSNTLGSTFVEKSDAIRSESVRVLTIDQFCAGRGIEHIDILKIDVEGFETEVLDGAENMLAGGKIDLAFLEVGLTDTNRLHVHYGDIRALLRKHGFVSMGLFDVKYWVADPFGNALFVREDLLPSGLSSRLKERNAH